MNTIEIYRELATILPVLFVWFVGLVVAIWRWREHPKVSWIVVIACAVSLLTPLLMPVAMNVASKTQAAFYSPLVSLIHICLSALSIGLLLYAVFLGRGEKVSENVKKHDEGVPMALIGGRRMVLGILADIARWAWRIMSIAVMLFVGTFIMAGPQNLLLMAIWVIVFAVLIWAWRHEGLLSLILLLVIGIPTGIDVIINLFKGGKLGSDVDASGYFLLITSMLVVVSWALHALNNSMTTPRKRRLVLIVAPVLAVAIVLCVVAMLHAPFNP